MPEPNLKKSLLSPLRTIHLDPSQSCVALALGIRRQAYTLELNNLLKEISATAIWLGSA